MLFFMEAVGFAWVEHQFRSYSVAFEAAVKLEALADRIDGVGFALQNQVGVLAFFKCTNGELLRKPAIFSGS